MTSCDATIRAHFLWPSLFLGLEIMSLNNFWSCTLIQRNFYERDDVLVFLRRQKKLTSFWILSCQQDGKKLKKSQFFGQLTWIKTSFLKVTWKQWNKDHQNLSFKFFINKSSIFDVFWVFMGFDIAHSILHEICYPEKK